MNEEERKINNIQKQLGVILLQNGNNFIKTAFNVSVKKTLTKNELSVWMGKNVFPGVSLYDEKYLFERIDFWKSFINLFWGWMKKYLADGYDCDNYAYYFSSMAAYLFGLNTAGVSSGTVYKAATGNKIDRHAFNLILALDENGEVKPYLFESMNNTLTPWIGQKTQLNDWLYEIDWSTYF
jgi:hypothetical protein